MLKLAVHVSCVTMYEYVKRHIQMQTFDIHIQYTRAAVNDIKRMARG